MWSMATAESWHAEQAEAMGDFTSVVSCASQGAETLQDLSVAVQAVAGPVAGLVMQVHWAAAEHVVVPCLKTASTPCTLTVSVFTTTEHGFAAVQMHGLAGVQAVVPCVPLTPSGRL